MRIVFWGTYDTGKPRTRILREGLREAGAEVEEIHRDIWGGIEDKSQLRGIGRIVLIALRWLLAQPRLAWLLARTPAPDLVLVGYPGHLDIFIAAVICRLRKIPLVFDVFLSAYDTVCVDRRLLRADGPAGRLLKRFEGASIRRADLAFMDTQAHARRVEALFGLPAGHCDAVWVGVEEGHFPRSPSAPPSDSSTKVLFYGQFIPLHGVPVIVGAARLLSDHDIEWQLIGKGQDAEMIRTMLEEQPLPKLRWVEWVPYEDLRNWTAAADLCLGIFGTSEKSACVIPNKVFQVLSAGRPIVTRDGPGVRELLAPSDGCTYLVQAGRPDALAEAVLRHHRYRSTTPPILCHDGLPHRINVGAIGRQFLDMIGRRNIAG